MTGAVLSCLLLPKLCCQPGNNILWTTFLIFLWRFLSNMILLERHLVEPKRPHCIFMSCLGLFPQPAWELMYHDGTLPHQFSR